MKAQTIFAKLRKLDVPSDRARLAANQYGDESGIPTPTQTVQTLLKRAARRKAAEQQHREFRVWCRANGLPLPSPEYRFALETTPRRNYRFDYCWIPEKVALEVNGGTWRKEGGAHQGKGFIRDMNKLNLAQRLGYVVLQRTPQNLCTEETVELLRDALNARAVHAEQSEAS